MNHIISMDEYICNQSSAYLERPRIQKLLDEAMHYKMVAVYAGAGYGKTREVYSYLQEHDAYTTWIQITERDNVESSFWEKYAHMISLTWPDVGEQLMKIGFPDTEAAFAKFNALRSSTLDVRDKFFLVYDDFHLLHNPSVLRFFERSTTRMPYNGTVILISRTMPEINLISLLMSERSYSIHEDVLCFTEDEIAQYFSQLAVPVNRQDIRDIYDDTHGWAFAINLIRRSLGKDGRYERYALEAMKDNIFKLVESEVSQSVSEPLWRFLLRVSLVDNYAASMIRILSDDEGLIGEMEGLNAYIRYDYYQGAYMIHHLFLEYLRQHQDQLTEEEKRDTYNKAADWCQANNYQTDALSYYEKAKNWDAILAIVYSMNFPVPEDTAKYIQEILDSARDSAIVQNHLYPTIMLKLKMSLGLLDEASALAEKFTGVYSAMPESREKNDALSKMYGAWAVLQMIKSTYTDVYDFDAYFQKQREFFDKGSQDTAGPITNLMITSYTLLVGTNRAGAPEEYIDAVSRSVPHTAHMQNDSFYGLDDLTRGELYFFKRELNSAEQYLKQALDKARSKNQYEVQNRSMLYLMLVAFSRGDIQAATGLLQQIESLLDVKDYAARYEAADIARSHYYLALGQPEEVPDWLKADFSPYTHPAFLENYANRLKAQYRYMTRQYNELLAFLANVQEKQSLLIGRIAFKVLEALSLYQLKRRGQAIAALTEAYTMAAPNGIIVPFTQHSKDMRTLSAAAMKEDSCPIPREWLENINRKSSAYAKRQANMTAESKNAAHRNDEIALTKREMDVLNDLSQGLTRSEIAASLNISVNTVKMMTNSIYEKLNVASLPEAIRVAVARKIV